MHAYLAPSTAMQPLIHRWYAVPGLVAPHTGALTLTGRHLPALRGYVDDPRRHARALADPRMFTAPYLNPGHAGPDAVARLLNETRSAGVPRIRLAEDIDAARDAAAKRDDGEAPGSFHDDLPPSLRGAVTLRYDSAGRPALQFDEDLLYRSPAAQPEAQVVSLLERADPGQPFVYGSPVLPGGPGRTDLTVAFQSPLLDDLFAARLRPVDVEVLADGFNLAADRRPGFRQLFTTAKPPAQRPNLSGEIRMRYFGHGSVLLDFGGFTVLTDPAVGYADGFDAHYTIADLPEVIDVVVLNHGRGDHFSIETLLQLRRRIGRIVVPRTGGGIADVGLRPMLAHLGFHDVIELADSQVASIGPATVTVLPAAGADGEPGARATLIRLGGRGFLFAADTSLADPAGYPLGPDDIGPVDALFVSLDEGGVPMDSPYGALGDGPAARDRHREPSSNGPVATSADRLARHLRAGQVFVYALGIEPWLKHLTGRWYDPHTEPLKQVAILRELAARRGIPAELLYVTAERYWPACDVPVADR